MKILSFFLLIFTFSNLTWATVEYGTLDVLGGSTSLVLNQGDIFEVTNFHEKFRYINNTKTIFTFTAPDGTHRAIWYTYSSGTPFPENITIYGPSIITLGTDTAWIMYKLTRAPNPQPARAD